MRLGSMLRRHLKPLPNYSVQPLMRSDMLVPTPSFWSDRRTPQALVYLPMAGRKDFWTVLLDPVTADVLAYLPVDSF